MWIVSLVLTALVVLLLLHEIVLPLSKRRAVLFRGREGYATVALAIVAIGALQPWWLVGLAVQLAIWWVWRPWLVIGLSSEQLRGAVAKATTMVRMPATPQGAHGFDLGIRGRMRVAQIVPGVNLYLHHVTPDKKFILFQNVLRKTIQNFTLGR